MSDRPPPPPRIDTPRLVLRAWKPDDAASLKAAADRSHEHLRPWMPWAQAPIPLEETAEILAGFRAAFEEGRDWVYGIFARDGVTVLGGTGLHPRIAETGLEIG
jgi:RimJ/RimL family protein N-acetyltransferase